MAFLLDTNVFLWLHRDPERIRAAARRQLLAADAQFALSVASAWEMVVKQAAGKLALPGPARAWLPQAIDELRCDLLPLDLDHAREVALLPLHHRDPFDRMIVAQARVEGLTLVTADKALARYQVEILRA